MRRRTNRFLKAAAALLAVALLARFLRDRFGPSGAAGNDTLDSQQPRRERDDVDDRERRAEEHTLEGEERSIDSVTERDDELRVRRTEEELAAGTREVEAGAMRVRKNVRTDRESVDVPTRHEEVSVDRVPLSGEATRAEIGEDEVVVPVTEEEVVVSKRPVVKEEIRIRKEVVEDTEVVEADVRREEIDVQDETTFRRDT